MKDALDRLAVGEYTAYKRNRYARYWLGGGIAFALLAAIYAPFDGSAEAGDFATIAPFYISVLIGYFLSPFARDAFSFNPADAKYDEFESKALNDARSNSYWYILLLILALVAWLWLAASFDFTAPARPYDWSAIGMAFLIAGIALPAFIAECTVPMPPNEGGAEGEKSDGDGQSAITICPKRGKWMLSWPARLLIRRMVMPAEPQRSRSPSTGSSPEVSVLILTA
jgi:hypothetical protein